MNFVLNLRISGDLLELKKFSRNFFKILRNLWLPSDRGISDDKGNEFFIKFDGDRGISGVQRGRISHEFLCFYMNFWLNLGTFKDLWRIYRHLKEFRLEFLKVFGIFNYRKTRGRHWDFVFIRNRIYIGFLENF